MTLRSARILVLILLTIAPIASGCGSAAHTAHAAVPAAALAGPRQASLAVRGIHHYEYVFPDQTMFVYDIDHGHRLVQQVPLSGIRGIRGVAAAPSTHVLYISHGGDGSGNGNGSLLAYDLVTGRILWDRAYSNGVDSMAIDPAGKRIYMPDGELTDNGRWYVLDARSGRSIGVINAGTGPHNTIVSLNGKHVYLGGRYSSFLDVADTSTGRVIRHIGPLKPGVRPFTVNGRETLAYTTATGFLGFQLSSITSGRVLYTVGFGPGFGIPPGFGPSAPSHGISLSPNERQVWVIDAANGYVHVFDVSRVPARAPRRIADIKLNTPLTGNESGCLYDCARDGWLQHSRSDCFVYVGDSGDVLDTATLRPVAFLPALRNTRKMLEIDWGRGVPVATTSRSGLGYVTRAQQRSRSHCS